MGRKIIDDRAITLWTEDLYSLQMIGDFFNVSRPAVKKYLNKRGIDTKKQKRQTSCNHCGKPIYRNRAYIRNNRYNYCNTKCYHKYIRNPNYNQHRQSQRKARKLVKYHYPLKETDVVHHMDGNTENNDLSNLLVFQSHSDHMKWHRAEGIKSGVIPLWPEPVRQYALSLRKPA